MLFHYIGRPIRLGSNAVCIWFGVRCAIPDYFGANQWCRTCVSGNDNHSLLIISKEGQLAIQWVNIVVKSNKFPFPLVLVWDRKRVNVARYSVEDHFDWLMSRTSHSCLLETNGRTSERASIGRGLFIPFLGGQTSVLRVRSKVDRTSDGVKSSFTALWNGQLGNNNSVSTWQKQLSSAAVSLVSIKFCPKSNQESLTQAPCRTLTTKLSLHPITWGDPSANLYDDPNFNHCWMI